MKISQWSITAALLLSLFSAPLFGQNQGKYALNFRFGHQDRLIDLGGGTLGVTNAVNIRPVMTAGIERTWYTGKRGRFRLFQDAHAGFWRSPFTENYVFAGTRIGTEFRLFKQLRFTPSLAYRAGRVKATDQRYAYENGKWEAVRNSTPGFLRQTVLLDAQISWRFRPQSAHPIDVQFGTDVQAGWKFLPVSYKPNVFVYKAFQVGLRYGL
jgi:hypothetical protein